MTGEMRISSGVREVGQSSPLVLTGVDPRAKPDWSPKAVLALLAGTTALRALPAALLPISGDEAYLYDCSRYLDWCYYDQPGLVIWAMIPFRWLFGETALAVRCPVLLSSFLFGFFIWRIVRRLGGSNRQGAIAWGLLNAAPIFLFGAGYTGCDGPLLACYAAAVLAAMTIAAGEKRGWWGFGLAIGLGFLAKYPIVVALPVLIPVLARPAARAHLRTAVPWLAALLGIILTLPVWIWGAQHNWDHFRFQFGRVPEGFTPLNLLGFWLVSLALLTPTLGLAALLAWFTSRQRWHSSAWSIYRWGVASPIVFWSFIAMRGHVGIHWSAPGTLLSLAAVAVLPFPGRKMLIAAAIATTAVVAPLVASIFVLPTTWLRMERELRDFDGRRDKLELHNLFGTDELATEVARRLRPGELGLSERPTDVHLVSFVSGGTVPARLFRGGRHNLGSFYWYSPGELLGRDFLVFTSDDESHDWKYRATFDSVEVLEPLVIHSKGHTVRTWRFLRCRNLRDARWLTRLQPGQEASDEP